MTMSGSQVRVVDPVLSTVVQGYKNPELVGSYLFPRVYVPAAGGNIIEFNKAAFELANSVRAPGANTKRISFGYAGKPYSAPARKHDSAAPQQPIAHVHQETPSLPSSFPHASPSMIASDRHRRDQSPLKKVHLPATFINLVSRLLPRPAICRSH